MSKWLRDGIEGRDLKATLRLYLVGLLLLAPPAALIGYLFGDQAAFQVTPLLVLLLIGVEYGLCYPEKFSRLIPRHRPSSSLIPGTTLQQEGETPKVKIIGVGGAGSSAVNAMMHGHITGVECIVVDTYRVALDSNLAPVKLHLGSALTKGLGAKANPELGKQAAWQDIDKISAAVGRAHVVFIVAGLGGGTGSGAVPVMAKIAREIGSLTVAVVTKPFAFEGHQRVRQAEAAIQELHGYVDALIVISNQLLLEVVDKRTSLGDAFKVVDDIIRQAVQGITDLITVSGAFRFTDIRKFLSGMGMGSLGIGIAHGEQRAEQAIRQALSSPLLEGFPVAKARRVLVNFTGDPDLSSAAVHKAIAVVHEVVRDDASMIFGSIVNESMRNEVRVIILAADFDTDANASPSKRVSLTGKCLAFKYTTGTILIDYPAEPHVESPI